MVHYIMICIHCIMILSRNVMSFTQYITQMVHHIITNWQDITNKVNHQTALVFHISAYSNYLICISQVTFTFQKVKRYLLELVNFTNWTIEIANKLV